MGGKFHPKLNTCGRPIANKYREGKMKRTLKRESKVLEIAGIEGMASSIGRGIFGRAFRFDRFAIGLIVFVGRFAAGTRTRPVLRPRSGWISGGREWFREGGCPFGGRSYRPGQMDCWRLRCENPHPIRGWGLRAMVGWRWRVAMPRVGCQSPKCGQPTCVVWDPDEMVVIHPS